MHELAQNWGWTFASTIVLVGAAFIIQVRNMKKLTFSFADKTSPFSSFYSGQIPVFSCLLGAFVGFVLTVVGIVANLLGK